MEHGKTDSPLNTHKHTHTANSANKCPFILGLNSHDSISHTPLLALILWHTHTHKHFPMQSFNI